MEKVLWTELWLNSPGLAMAWQYQVRKKDFCLIAWNKNFHKETNGRIGAFMGASRTSFHKEVGGKPDIDLFNCLLSGKTCHKIVQVNNMITGEPHRYSATYIPSPSTKTRVTISEDLGVVRKKIAV